MYSTDYSHQTKRVSSRLAKTESQKLMRQTMLFGGGAVVLLGIFVFVVLPGLIRLLAGGETINLPSEDSIPPQVPLLSAPADATSSAQIAVNGFAEAKSQIVVVLNGQEQQRTSTSEEGEFLLEVGLSEGSNSLTLYSIDEAGNESSQTPTYTIVYDNQVPTITLETPTDGQVIELRKNQTITIKGTTEPRAKVFVNDRLTTADSEGVFTTSLLLVEGENKIKIDVTDQAGNSATTELAVTFKL